MDGIGLALKFSSAPNRLGLCGPEGMDASGKSRKQAVALLRKFWAPYQYYGLIAKANGRDIFDYKVVEAFWIGNSLLDNVKGKDVAKMILNKFTGKGRLGMKRARTLAENLPEKVYPHHSFHVLCIGSVSGVIRSTTSQKDKCRIAWGMVNNIAKNGQMADVCHLPLERYGKTLYLGKLSAAKWKITPGMERIKRWDYVCSHWGQAIMKISNAQKKSLEKYTKLNIDLRNSAQSGA